MWFQFENTFSIRRLFTQLQWNYSCASTWTNANGKKKTKRKKSVFHSFRAKMAKICISSNFHMSLCICKMLNTLLWIEFVTYFVVMCSMETFQFSLLWWVWKRHCTISNCNKLNNIIVLLCLVCLCWVGMKLRGTRLIEAYFYGKNVRWKHLWKRTYYENPQ